MSNERKSPWDRRNTRKYIAGTVRPKHGRCLVERYWPVPDTILEIPDSVLVSNSPNVGIVVEVGPDSDERVGDIIVFAPHETLILELDGCAYYVVEDRGVEAVLNTKNLPKPGPKLVTPGSVLA